VHALVRTLTWPFGEHGYTPYTGRLPPVLLNAGGGEATAWLEHTTPAWELEPHSVAPTASAAPEEDGQARRPASLPTQPTLLAQHGDPATDAVNHPPRTASPPWNPSCLQTTIASCQLQSS
jgi:hypothetical protein